MAAPAPRVPGRVQEPWTVVALALVTLGFYAFFWTWRVTREADAWKGEDLRAHAAFRRSLALFLVALVPYALAFVLLFGKVAREGPVQTEDLGVFLALGLAAVAIAVAGTVYYYVALWRVWRTIEEEERGRGVPAASPPLFVVLTLVPYVNLVGWVYVLWRTQKGLNGMYEAAGGPSFVPSPA